MPYAVRDRDSPRGRWVPGFDVSNSAVLVGLPIPANVPERRASQRTDEPFFVKTIRNSGGVRLRSLWRVVVAAASQPRSANAGHLTFGSDSRARGPARAGGVSRFDQDSEHPPQAICHTDCQEALACTANRRSPIGLSGCYGLVRHVTDAMQDRDAECCPPILSDTQRTALGRSGGPM